MDFEIFQYQGWARVFSVFTGTEPARFSESPFLGEIIHDLSESPGFVAPSAAQVSIQVFSSNDFLDEEVVIIQVDPGVPLGTPPYLIFSDSQVLEIIPEDLSDSTSYPFAPSVVPIPVFSESPFLESLPEIIDGYSGFPFPLSAVVHTDPFSSEFLPAIPEEIFLDPGFVSTSPPVSSSIFSSNEFIPEEPLTLESESFFHLAPSGPGQAIQFSESPFLELLVDDLFIVPPPSGPQPITWTTYGLIKLYRDEHYPPSVTLHFEAVFRATAGTVYARAIDHNTLAEISGSLISTSSPVMTRIRSGDIRASLVDLQELRAQFGTEPGAAGFFLGASIEPQLP